MTPAARLAASIEVLQAAADGAPVDGALKAWGRAHRFAGSGDRRAIAERVWATLRGRAAAAWRMGDDSPRALLLGALVEADGSGVDAIESLFAAGGHGPAPLTGAERARLAAAAEPAPDWVRAGVPEFVAELLSRQYGGRWAEEARALVGGRAHLDVRVNLARADRNAVRSALAEAGIAAEFTPYSAHGLRLAADTAPDLTRLPLFAAGGFEVQDEGSQMVSWLAGARPGMTLVDYCAGGGGKTLALGTDLSSNPGGGEGRLYAFDMDAKRLDSIRPRLARAGVAAELAVIGPDGEGTEPLLGAADLVLVDAPCSGSGTWRRRPEAPWRLTPGEVERLAALQGEILAGAARLVRPGGRLAYVTCSVLPPENEAVASSFAAAHPAFQPVPIEHAADTPALTDAGRARLATLAAGAHTVQLSPLATDTDGFFAALFERSA